MQADEHRPGHKIILSRPEQWSDEGVHKMHELHTPKCQDTNHVVNITFGRYDQHS